MPVWRQPRRRLTVEFKFEYSRLVWMKKLNESIYVLVYGTNVWNEQYSSTCEMLSFHFYLTGVFEVKSTSDTHSAYRHVWKIPFQMLSCVWSNISMKRIFNEYERLIMFGWYKRSTVSLIGVRREGRQQYFWPFSNSSHKFAQSPARKLRCQVKRVIVEHGLVMSYASCHMWDIDIRQI